MYQRPIFIKGKYKGYIKTVIYLYFRSPRLSIELGHIQNFIIFIEKTPCYINVEFWESGHMLFTSQPLQQVVSSEPIFKELKKKKKKKNQIKSNLKIFKNKLKA